MRLSESDAGFLYGETASGALQTAGIAVIAGEIPFETIYNHIESRLHLVPSFRRRAIWVPMNLAHPKWVDDPDFELSNHIVHHPLAAGTPLLDAIDVAVKLNEGLMNRERPLWKYVVITGVENRTLLLQQIHHAMIDGASAVHLSTVMFDFQVDAPPTEPPEHPWQPEPLPTAEQLVTEALTENAQALMEHAQSLARTNPFAQTQANETSRNLLNTGSQTLSRFVTQPAITAPWNAAPIGPNRKMRWSTFSIAEFREIRRAFGGTINDVVLHIVTAAAARYLDDHGETTSNQYLRIMCPVNVRTENETGALGNRVSAMFPTLPAWPMEANLRYQSVVEETLRIKDSNEAQALTLMQEQGYTAPPVGLAPLQLVGTPYDPTAMAAMAPPVVFPQFGPRPPLFGINLVCTNVPGVQVPQYLAGHEILDTTSIMMISGNSGYSLCVTSYNQKMLFNYTCDPRLMPDLETMVDAAEASFSELLELARQHNTNPGE
ncbi:MAG: diacylglycerol O-acyltransferase [Candidatus Azotimanducaceae bacterium]|jgi:diacylglycerol O-acyltransferase